MQPRRARRHPSRLASRPQRRQQNPNQERDHSDHDEQLNKREGAAHAAKVRSKTATGARIATKRARQEASRSKGSIGRVLRRAINLEEIDANVLTARTPRAARINLPHSRQIDATT
jgi:hypothetical protein